MRMPQAIATSRRASPTCRGTPEADITALTRLIFAAYFLEAGLILIVAPWSAFWDHNILAAWYPPAAALITNAFVRGAVTGIGLITAVAGLIELAGVFGLRRREQPAGDAPAD
jgi:hypothetical protein